MAPVSSVNSSVNLTGDDGAAGGTGTSDSGSFSIFS